MYLHTLTKGKPSPNRKSISEKNLCTKNQVFVVLFPLSGGGGAENLQEGLLVQSVWHTTAVFCLWGAAIQGPHIQHPI